MSASGTIVTAAHLDYIRAHTVTEDPFLRELVRAADAAGIPGIRIAPEQAAFVHLALRAVGARQVVEVGTLAGYSAIWMARALSDGGRVRTIELAAERADFAEDWIARSDVAGRIEVHRGDGRDVLPTFADNSADAAFIDADKVGYPTYLDHCRRITRPGGLLMVDNAFAFGHLPGGGKGDPDVAAIGAFNAAFAASGLRGIIVPFGDGMWFAINS